MSRFALILCGLAAPALAGDWARLDSEGISRILTDKKVTYGDATQWFYASGRTLYVSGRPSWGYWEARDGRYCSQWPPTDGWACYDVETDGADGVRFIGDSGDVTDGLIIGQE